MAHKVPPAQMDKSQAPPPCIITGQPEEQALAQAKGFLTNVYAAIDQPDPAARNNIPFRADSIASFQHGASDRFVGPPIVQSGAFGRLHQGQQRDLSGLSVQIFPGNSMFCLICGDMITAASAPQSLRHRFADMFLVCSDAQGPHVKNMVMREIDEQIPAPPAGAAQDPKLQQGDQMAQQFLPYFYGQLDDPAKRGGLTSLFKDVSCVTVGNDLFKTTQHIAHKFHYFPTLTNGPAGRQIQGCDVQTSPAGGYFVFAHGEIHMSGEEHTQRFIDAFHLMPEGSSWWISNLIIKMHGGGSR